MKSNDELDEEVLRIDRQRAGLKFIDAAAWEGCRFPTAMGCSLCGATSAIDLV